MTKLGYTTLPCIVLIGGVQQVDDEEMAVGEVISDEVGIFSLVRI